MMKKVILILILTVMAANSAGLRKFRVAFMIAGNGSTQYTVVEAPDASTAQQLFKHYCRECRFISYTEIK
jgi:hypothetical protein